MAVLALPLTVGGTIYIVDKFGPSFVRYMCMCILGLQIVAVPTYTYISQFLYLTDFTVMAH